MHASTIEDRVAIVTGAANGFGRTTALALADAGADLGLLDLDTAGLETLRSEIETLGGRAVPVPLDCTDPVHVKTAFKQARAVLGPVDILVNGVGQSARGQMTDVASANLETFDFFINVNLKSCVLCCHEGVADMLVGGSGKIIYVASESAVIGSPRSWDYAAAKAGVIGFTRAIAQELAPHGINVNAIGPGATRTRDRCDAQRDR